MVNTLSLGQKVRNVRLARGLSQEELAARVGWKRSCSSTISFYESGSKKITQNMKYRLFRALGVDPMLF